LGDEVKGVLRLGLKEQSVLKKFKISLNGLAEVKWIERTGTQFHKDGYVYQDTLELINLDYSLPNQFEELSAGEHEVPFSFKLPDKDLPSSFSGSHGSILYYIKVIIDDIDIPEGQRVTRKEFAVDAPSKQKYNVSIGGYNEKELSLLNIGHGKIRIFASLPKKGYTPGETIELHITVENDSSATVKPRATLYQQQIYMCGERHKGEKVTLSDRVFGKDVESKTDFTETLFVPIPEDASLTIKSQLISIKFFIHVTLDIPHAHDIDVNVPFVMVPKSAL